MPSVPRIGYHAARYRSCCTPDRTRALAPCPRQGSEAHATVMPCSRRIVLRWALSIAAGSASVVTGACRPAIPEGWRPRTVAILVALQPPEATSGGCSLADVGPLVAQWLHGLTLRGPSAKITAAPWARQVGNADAVVPGSFDLATQIVPYCAPLEEWIKPDTALLGSLPHAAWQLGQAYSGPQLVPQVYWLPLLYDPLVVFYRPRVLGEAGLGEPPLVWSYLDWLAYLHQVSAANHGAPALALSGEATRLTATVAARRRGALPWPPAQAFFMNEPDTFLLAITGAYGVSLLPTGASSWDSSACIEAVTVWQEFMDAGRLPQGTCPSPFEPGDGIGFQLGFVSDALRAERRALGEWRIAPVPGGPRGRVVPARIIGLGALHAAAIQTVLDVYRQWLESESGGPSGASGIALPIVADAGAQILSKETITAPNVATAIADISHCVPAQVQIVEAVEHGSSSARGVFGPQLQQALLAGIGNLAMVAAATHNADELGAALKLARRATENALVAQGASGVRTHVHCMPDGQCALI
jgi:hypothetical protein